jgi:hypothetical protein
MRYKETSSGNWQTANFIVNQCTIQGLSPLTNYEFQVQYLCTITLQSPWTTSFYFSTPVRKSDPIIKTDGDDILSVFPNPFSEELKVAFELNDSKKISISIFEPTGRKISDLVNDNLGAGLHSFIWRTSDESSGIYFIVYNDGESIIRKKVILVRND